MTDALLASDEALHFQPEWWRVALASIADAVITSDIEGRVTFLNSVATSLTGWEPAQSEYGPSDRNGSAGHGSDDRQAVDERVKAV